MSSHTTAAATTPAPAVADVELRRCAWHDVEHPVSDFALKDPARGTYQSYCRDGMREYNRQYHANAGEERLKQLKERKKRVRGEARDELRRIAQRQVCSGCGASGEQVRLCGHVPDGQTPPSDLVRRGVSIETLRGVIADGEVTWRCRRCEGRRVGAAGKGRARQGRERTVADAVLAACEDGDEHPVAGLWDEVNDGSLEVSRRVVAVTCSQLVAAGLLERVARGVYRLAGTER